MAKLESIGFKGSSKVIVEPDGIAFRNDQSRPKMLLNEK